MMLASQGRLLPLNLQIATLQNGLHTSDTSFTEFSVDIEEKDKWEGIIQCSGYMCVS